MGERILVFKNKRGKKSYTITNRVTKGYAHKDCSMTINLENYKDVALFLHDLEDLFSAPIEKAVRQYLLDKDTGWPF